MGVYQTNRVTQVLSMCQTLQVTQRGLTASQSIRQPHKTKCFSEYQCI